MFDKIKDLGAQVANRATDAVDGITTSVKGGVESLANTATTVSDALNEKAVRTSTAQMCHPRDCPGRTQGKAAGAAAGFADGDR